MKEAVMMPDRNQQEFLVVMGKTFDPAKPEDYLKQASRSGSRR